ncbi:MAG: hypothetical protein U0N74_09980, partial [Peptococcaceae bacterium]
MSSKVKKSNDLIYWFNVVLTVVLMFGIGYLEPWGSLGQLICTLFTGHPVERVFFMRYTYEFKRECIRLYREGKWPQTPSGIKECN